MYIFYGLCVLTASLGVWQSKRYLWKIDLVQEAEKNLKKESKDLTSLSSSTMSQSLYEKFNGKFVISGEYDYKNEILIGPRSAPANTVSKQAQGMATNALGYFVLTPFKCVSAKELGLKSEDSKGGSQGNDSEYTILVNRGWIPIEMSLQLWMIY